MNLERDKLKARIYTWTLELIKLIDSMPKGLISDVVGRQMIRSGTSVIANFTEATGASSRKDFTDYYHYALKSANETKVWLAILRDTNKIKPEQANKLLNEVSEISKIIASCIISLKK